MVRLAAIALSNKRKSGSSTLIVVLLLLLLPAIPTVWQATQYNESIEIPRLFVGTNIDDIQLLRDQQSKTDEQKQHALQPLQKQYQGDRHEQGSRYNIGANNKPHPRLIIVSVWTHYPDFLELHITAFRLFLKDLPFEYICVLNSRSGVVNEALRQVAEKHSHGTHLSIDVSPSADASHHHAHALHQVLHDFLLHPESPVPLTSKDVLFLVDSDIFLLQSITDLFDPLDLGDNPSRLISGSTNENTIISMQQSRQGLTYLWPNFLLLQLEDVPMYRDLSFAPVVAQLNKEELVSLDSGGATYIFLQKYGPQFLQSAMTWIRSSTSCDANSTKTICSFYQEQLAAVAPSNCQTPELLIVPTEGRDEKFYHLGSAGYNWRQCPEEYLANRRHDLKHYLMEQQKEQ